MENALYIELGLLGLALVLALLVTCYAVLLVATPLFESRRLDRLRFVHDMERQVELLLCLPGSTIDKGKADRVREILAEARDGRDGTAEIYVARLVRAVALVAFPLVAIPLALFTFLQFIEIAGWEDATTTLTATIVGKLTLPRPTALVGDLNATASIPLQLSSLVSPLASAVLAQLAELLGGLKLGFRVASLVLIAAVFLGLWFLVGLTALVGRKAGGGKRTAWEQQFREAWNDMLPPQARRP